MGGGGSASGVNTAELLLSSLMSGNLSMDIILNKCWWCGFVSLYFCACFRLHCEIVLFLVHGTTQH